VDAATEEFMAFVSDTIPALPILVVLTHRPGYTHPFGDRSYHARVPLQPLSEVAMASMVGSVLDSKELPSALRLLIAEKAEGNPLFVEEVTTSLLEEGVLALKEGRVRLTRDLAEVAVPDRIQDVLMARLDRLPEEPKRAIQLASVIGREFAMRLLSRIHEAGAQLDEIVGELRSLELIYEKSSHPELAYMFKHALTHEVAYESVLVARRKALHRVVGTAIEELYQDRIVEHYEALAHHFGESEDDERAFRYHELASEKSAAAYANHAAIDHCRKALALAARLGDVEEARILALQVRVAECCWMTSDFGASGEAYRAAAEVCPDPGEASLLHGFAGMSYLWDHDYAASERSVERAVDLSSKSGAKAGRAFARIVQDECQIVHGRALDDDTLPLETLALAEQAGNPAVHAWALAQCAQRAEWRSEYRRCIQLGSQAVEVATRNGAPGDALFASWFLAIACVCIGDYARGLGLLGSGLELCDRIGDRAIQARLLNTMGWAHAELGCHERAAEFNRAGTVLAREAVELGLVAGAPELYANGAINLAGNLMALGRFDEAAEQLAPIQEQFDDDPDPWMRWRWSVRLRHHQARLAFGRGDPEGALELARDEVERLARVPAPKLECRALEQIGRIHLALGEHERAAPELARAVEIADEIEHPSVAWRARSLRAELASRRGERAEADRERAIVAAHFERLAPGIPDQSLRRGFRELEQGILSDPLGAHR
jgi:tetratricopeptide (TPR) repeat protein